MKYEPVIGLEIHVQLSTASKLFCGCSVAFGAEPNTLTCPVCLGLPGTLPVVNGKAVELGVLLALALQCRIHEQSYFVRKHYFYPDLPKGYQITQYDAPLAVNGELVLNSGGSPTHCIRIERVHLEEDAGRLVHDETYVSGDQSLVDLNRCGVPLAEIVTAPDIRTPNEAKQTVQALLQLIRWLGVSDGRMAEGSLRCDANISLQTPGAKKPGLKTEIKNINSLRGVERSLSSEIDRQRKILQNSGQVRPETLLWDESNNQIVPMRSKEEADDYRYFPEPDLPPLILSGEWIQVMQEEVPELPAARKQRFIHDFNLSTDDAVVLTEDRDISNFFEETVQCGAVANEVAQWVRGEVLHLLHATGDDVHCLKLKPDHLAEIIELVRNGTLNRPLAKKVIDEVIATGVKPSIIIKEKGWLQISDGDTVLEKVDKVLKNHPQEVDTYRAGEEKLFRFFMGQVMAEMKGRGDPKMIRETLRDRLNS